MVSSQEKNEVCSGKGRVFVIHSDRYHLFNKQGNNKRIAILGASELTKSASISLFVPAVVGTKLRSIQ